VAWLTHVLEVAWVDLARDSGCLVDRSFLLLSAYPRPPAHSLQGASSANWCALGRPPAMAHA
jgi:hypothetical protein